MVNSNLVILLISVVALILIIVNLKQNSNKKEGEKKDYTYIIIAVFLLLFVVFLKWLISKLTPYFGGERGGGYYTNFSGRTDDFLFIPD